jgi:hypothetical protein
MRNTGMVSFLVAIVVVLGGVCAYADQSASFSVGCSVPAIPGVNVPLVAEGDNETSSAPAEQSDETSVIVKDETRSEDQRITLVKTLYTK